jgi:acetyl-CoA carboxylase carboxyl transferase subunit beta
MRIFKKPFRYTLARKKKEIPDGLWSKCPTCSHLIFNKILKENLKVCPKCNHHFSLICWERIEMLADDDSFAELYENMESLDPLSFAGPKSYKDKLKEDTAATGLKDAIIVGDAKIDKRTVALGVTDSRFIMGSMASVVGEKITRHIDHEIEKKLPVVIVSGSGGGARMYEGLLSLMQMAKTCGALSRLKEARLPFISVLTHPTMAGVMASFAGIGDVIMAEPGALIGFTGPRVIKQTIKQDLPNGVQTSEFNLEHGLLYMVVHRKDLKATLSKLLNYLT